MPGEDDIETLDANDLFDFQRLCGERARIAFEQGAEEESERHLQLQGVALARMSSRRSAA